MTERSLDREAEISRLKAVAEEMAQLLNVRIVPNDEKERTFASGTPRSYANYPTLD